MALDQQREKTPHPSRHRVMVVDSDKDMSRFLNLTLEREGFDTIVVADAELATELLKNLKPDLVVLDTASSRDSLHMLDRIRQHSDVPVIVLGTGHEAQPLWDAISRGADDYIRMPFGVRSFIARIRAKLRRAPHSQEP